MKVASLGSGSKGNATLISNAQTTLLLDCGFSLKQLEKRAEAFGINLTALSAILVTHEHSDHISGVAKLANKYQIPVYITLGSVEKITDCLDNKLMHTVYGGQSLTIGDICVQVVTVPHDCSEPVQYVFSCNTTDTSIGVLTDIGHISSHVIASYSKLNALLLEFNYDQTMLETGPYPQSLKQRVSGNYGHLSNEQSIGLLRSIDCSQLKTLIIGHISEKNNHPEIIENLLKNETYLPKPMLATQTEGFSWVSL